jgi:hypothetical protein
MALMTLVAMVALGPNVVGNVVGRRTADWKLMARRAMTFVIMLVLSMDGLGALSAELEEIE